MENYVPYVIIYSPFHVLCSSLVLLMIFCKNWLREPGFVMKINEKLCKDVRAHKNWSKTHKRYGLPGYISWLTRDSIHNLSWPDFTEPTGKSNQRAPQFFLGGAYSPWCTLWLVRGGPFSPSQLDFFAAVRLLGIFDIYSLHFCHKKPIFVLPCDPHSIPL